MRRLKWALFLLPLAASCVFIINLCSILFQCGCASWWNGAAAHCNIHNPAGRHCPWCAHDGAFWGVLALVLTLQAVLIVWPIRLDWRYRLAAAFLIFPVMGSLAAILMGLIDGYWSHPPL